MVTQLVVGRQRLPEGSPGASETDWGLLGGHGWAFLGRFVSGREAEGQLPPESPARWGSSDPYGPVLPVRVWAITVLTASVRATETGEAAPSEVLTAREAQRAAHALSPRQSSGRWISNSVAGWLSSCSGQC